MAKDLDDVRADMSALYDELRNGEVDIKTASELANITGKFLKAEQLKLAREIFETNRAVVLIERHEREVDQLEAAE
jgi:activator of HSP90 ATPase